MSNANETITDIIRKTRAKADSIEESVIGLLKAGEGLYGVPFTESDLEPALDFVMTKRKEADRLEAAWKREKSEIEANALAVGGLVEASRATAKKSSAVGDCAKLREALSDASHAMFNFLKTQYGGYEEMANALDKARVTLAKPPRNCDRFGGDIDKLREACARERGLNPEEDFPEVFCEWLLAKAKGENDVK